MAALGALGAPEAPEALGAPEEIKEPSPFIACCIICGEEKHVLSCGKSSHSMCCSCAPEYKNSIYDLITCNGCNTPDPVFYNSLIMPEEYLIYIIKKVHDFPDKLLLILSRQDIINMVETIIKKQKNKYYYEKEFYKTKAPVCLVVSSNLVNKVENLLTGIIVCKNCEKPVCQGDGCAALICGCNAAICAICGETITEASFTDYPQYPDGHGPEEQPLYNKRNRLLDIGHNHVDAKHNYNQDDDFAVEKPDGEKLESQYFDKKMKPDIGIGMHRFKFLVKELILLLNELLPKSSIEEIQKCSKLIHTTFPFFYETFKETICKNGIYILHVDITDEKNHEEVFVIKLLEKSHQGVLSACLESYGMQLESLNIKYDRLKSDCEKKNVELRRLERELGQYHDMNAKQQRYNQKLNHEIDDYKQKIKEFERKNKEFEREIDDYKQKIKEFNKRGEFKERKEFEERIEMITDKHHKLLIAYHELRMKPHSKYKTVECRNFQNGKGICEYGTKCAFKHTVDVDIGKDKPVEVVEDID